MHVSTAPRAELDLHTRERVFDDTAQIRPSVPRVGGCSHSRRGHTPHATRHTPHATRHTPHATRRTPHATRRTPHALRRARAEVNLVIDRKTYFEFCFVDASSSRLNAYVELTEFTMSFYDFDRPGASGINMEEMIFVNPDAYSQARVAPGCVHGSGTSTHARRRVPATSTPLLLPLPLLRLLLLLLRLLAHAAQHATAATLSPPPPLSRSS